MIYTEEIKEQILSEHEAGISASESASWCDLSATAIQNGKRQAKANARELGEHQVQARAALAEHPFSTLRC